MDDVIIAGSLLACTIAASLVYYKRIRRAQEQVDASMGTVSKIMASFSRQLAQVGRRVDALQLAMPRGNEDPGREDFREIVRSSIEGISSRASKVESEIVSLKSKVEQMVLPTEAGTQPSREGPMTSSRQIMTATAPAPKGTPLAALNPTELLVLGLLDRQGELTGPKIRDALGRTREHTARLLKKLYDAGFIDRTSGQMPYKYRIRKELTDLLRSDQKKMDLTP